MNVNDLLYHIRMDKNIQFHSISLKETNIRCVNYLTCAINWFQRLTYLSFLLLHYKKNFAENLTVVFLFFYLLFIQYQFVPHFKLSNWWLSWGLKFSSSTSGFLINLYPCLSLLCTYSRLLINVLHAYLFLEDFSYQHALIRK